MFLTTKEVTAKPHPLASLTAAKQLSVCTGKGGGRSIRALVAWMNLQKDARPEPATPPAQANIGLIKFLSLGCQPVPEKEQTC